MAVSKKYRRRINRKGKVFYWYVNSDCDDEGKINVHILSEDKRFIVAYEIGQVARQLERPFLVVMGREFVGFNGERIGYIRVQTPIWNDLSATPSLVGEIIDWCYIEKKEIVLVDWNGKVIKSR